MSDRELSIKIRIAEREYPMRIPAEQEQLLRSAGRLINDKLKQYRDSFGIDDKQDLLAMVAFDALVEALKKDQSSSDDAETVDQELHQLTTLLHTALQDKPL